MKLFVDDFRECPEGWVLARTVTEAIRILATQNVEEVSLDHDIRVCANERCTNRNETFEPVAWYLREVMVSRSYGEAIRVRFHTGNCDAARRMAAILGVRYDPHDLYKHENYQPTPSPTGSTEEKP